MCAAHRVLLLLLGSIVVLLTVWNLWETEQGAHLPFLHANSISIVQRQAIGQPVIDIPPANTNKSSERQGRLFPPGYFHHDELVHLRQFVYMNSSFWGHGLGAAMNTGSAVVMWRNGKEFSIPLLDVKANPSVSQVQCGSTYETTVLLFSVFIAKNFAEIIFQTLEPLARALHALGVSKFPLDPSIHRVIPMLVGSRIDYDTEVFKLPFQLLGSLIPLSSLRYLEDTSSTCFRELVAVSQDVHYIYRFSFGSPDIITQEYHNTVPADYQQLWMTLANAILSHILGEDMLKVVRVPLGSLRPQQLNVTLIARSTDRTTHFGAHRDFARSILNQNELISKLHHLGFPAIRVVVMEQLTLREQLELMQNTHVLIAVHGAGCMHAMFLPANAVFIQISPFMVEHDLYPRIALSTGHRCVNHQVPSISQAVFYSHTFPEGCSKVLILHVSELCKVPENPRKKPTASGLIGVDGSSYACFNNAILANKDACGANSYYWKQQDIDIDLAGFEVTIRWAMASRLVVQ